MSNELLKVQIFNEKNIRTAWNESEEEWYFSVVDVIAVLTEQKTIRGATFYWSKLKERLKKEGANELLTNCQQLKMQATDGKMRETDILSTKGILRLIQSIPSKKAEPFKVWLAKIGSERLDEIADPEKAILRGAEYYRKKGYDEKWITQRLKTIEMRKELTDEWKERGITKEQDYAILTNEMTKEWSGFTVQQYKKFKNLKKENLRDNMTNIELVLNMLAEVSTTEISKAIKPNGMDENIAVAKRGGKIAKNAKNDLEKQTKRKVVSKLNATNKRKLMIENNKK